MTDTALGEIARDSGAGASGAAVPGGQPDTAPAGPSGRPAAGPAGAQPLLRGAGIALLLLAALVLGFAGYLYGLSGVQEARSQAVMFTQLRNELAGQAAPLGAATPGHGPTAPGSPVAILNIPAIGVRDLVVVEGTAPQNLMLGPGLRRDSPLPGQAGVSVIYGRRATFGGPFARLGQLRPGDTIGAITGQGRFTYVVAAVAASTTTIADPAPNRLLLLTASSALEPRYYLTVDAHLIETPQAGPGVAPVINSSELPLSGDDGALALTTAMEWGVALALVSVGATVAAVRWSPWAAYLAAAPLILAVLWNLYQSLAALLPNLY